MARIDRINSENRMVETTDRASLADLLPRDRQWEDVCVTCGTAHQRGEVFYYVLNRAVSAGMPAVIFYSTDEIERRLNLYSGTVFLNPGRQRYMPLLGMNAQQAMSALSPGSGAADWEIGEAEALQMYLDLLVRLGLPVSLRHLLWLARLDRDSFTAYLRASSLPEAEKERILQRSASFYGGLRPVNLLVSNRAETLGLSVAREYLYEPYGTAADCSSILTAIRSSSVLAIRVDATAPSRDGLNLLCQELQIARGLGIPFLVACCDLIIPEGSALARQLQLSGSGMTTFLSTDHAPNAFPSQRADYWRGMLRGSLLVLNCNNPGMAASYEELFGNYQRIKTTKTRNYNRRALSILGTFGSATITAEETVPRVRQQALCGNPRGGVFSDAGSNELLIVGDLGL